MGGSDQLVVEAYGPSFASLIPDARVEVIPDAGHSLMLEEPDAFLKAVQLARGPYGHCARHGPVDAVDVLGGLVRRLGGEAAAMEVQAARMTPDCAL